MMLNRLWIQYLNGMDDMSSQASDEDQVIYLNKSV